MKKWAHTTTIVLDLHRVCNQKCSYCVSDSLPTNSFLASSDSEKWQNIFDFFSGINCSNVLLTGGEPLITPNLATLCSHLTGLGHTISLQTNLKSSPDVFMAFVPPENTGWILASFHSVALGEFETFLKHILLLKRKGYPVIVKLVLDDVLIQHLEHIYSVLNTHSIGVILSPLIRFSEGCHPRPQQYSQEYWEQISPRMTLLSSWLYFDGGFSSKGTQCLAGTRLIYISLSDGIIQGCCHGYPSYLGNIFDGIYHPVKEALACGLDHCICDFHYYGGFISGVSESDSFQNLINGKNHLVTFDAYNSWLAENSFIKPMGEIPRNLIKKHNSQSETERCVDAEITYEKKPSQMSIPAADINISFVHVFDLHHALQFGTPLDYPKSSLIKKFSQWKMEIDDAPIFRYIYRNARPRRHLEFGTWQGKGTVFCLEECDATVWTINRPFGEYGGAYGFDPVELDNAHQWARKVGMQVSEKGYASDSIGFIGKDYLERNLGNRVCQIYCDSREWDCSNYGEGFFDTVLVDGGHMAEVVANDTRKALSLLRSGGIIMWHDFCATDYQRFEACKGVMTGITREWTLINEHTEKLFWIYPSMILVGVKK